MSAQDSKKYTSKLAGKRVVVIGGSSGIGYGAAEAAVEFGADVTISSSNADRVKTAVEKLLTAYPSAKGRVQGEVAILGGEGAEKALEALFEKVGRPLDHVIYTAADKLAIMPVNSITREGIFKAAEMRVVGPLLTAKVASRYLTKTHESSIILTTGTIDERPIPDWSVVATFGAGLHGMTRNLALDLAPVRVNLVSPGMVDTDLWSDMPPEQYEVFKNETAKRLPTGSVAQASDIAEAYIYLMKDINITGSIIATNGGWLLK